MKIINKTTQETVEFKADDKNLTIIRLGSPDYRPSLSDLEEFRDVVVESMKNGDIVFTNYDVEVIQVQDKDILITDGSTILKSKEEVISTHFESSDADFEASLAMIDSNESSEAPKSNFIKYGEEDGEAKESSKMGKVYPPHLAHLFKKDEEGPLGGLSVLGSHFAGKFVTDEDD